MKIYLAGTWDAKDEIKRRAGVLEEHGFEITSTWLDFVQFGLYAIEKESVSRREAVNDLEDLREADMVVFNLDAGPSSSGATHAELGMALSLGKLICIVGTERPNIFYYHPNVTHTYDTWEGFLTAWTGQTRTAPQLMMLPSLNLSAGAAF